MKPEALVAVGLGCLFLIGTAAYFLGASPGGSGAFAGAPAAGSARAVASTASLDSGDGLAALKQRIQELEARVVKLEARPAPAASDTPSAARPTPSAGEPSALPAGDPAAPVTRGDVTKIVAAELRRRDAARKKAAASAAKQWQRPKKKLPEVARELGLDARQEGEIRTLYRKLGDESMKVLFEVKDGKGLDALKVQLEQAKHDPQLYEKLRAQVSINWTKHGTKFRVMWVKLDQDLRKVMPEDTLKKFYRYDVKLANPEWPDLLKMFFTPKKKKQ